MHDRYTARNLLAEHQLELVEHVSSATGGARFLIKAPPGSGKAVAAAVALGEVLSSAAGKPTALVMTLDEYVPLWQDLLHRWAGVEATVLDGSAYRMNQARYGGPYGGGSVFLASMDFLKIAPRADDTANQGWDFVLLDEVEAMGGRSARARLAKRLWRSPDVRVAVGSSTLPEPEWLARAPAVQKFDWREARNLLPRLSFQAVRFEYTDAERRLMLALRDSTAAPQQVTEHSAIETMLLRRAESSIYALDSSLRTLRSRLRAELPIAGAGDALGKDLLAGLRSSLKSGPSSSEDEAFTIGRATHGRLAVSSEWIESLLGLVGRIARDSKWERCASLVEQFDPGTQTIIIFSDFVDTADYVHNLSAERGWTTYRLTSQQPAEVRWASVEAASRGPAILVVTSASASALGAPVGPVIHYDLPRGSRDMTRRLGARPRYPSLAPGAENYVLLEARMTDSMFEDTLSRILPDGVRAATR